MDYASLPLGFGIELGKVVYQSQAHIRDKQLDALQTAILQFAQKLGQLAYQSRGISLTFRIPSMRVIPEK